MKRFILPVLLLFAAFLSCTGRRPQQSDTDTDGKKDKRQIYQIRLTDTLTDPTVADTFTVWKQFFRYWELPPQISREELEDRLSLMRNALAHMRRQKTPPRLDTVDVKSRLLLVENEIRQMQWALKHHWDQPRTDSLMKRWLGAYSSLVRQINFVTSQSEDFQRVFQEKLHRDSLLLKEFGNDKPVTQNPKPGK